MYIHILFTQSSLNYFQSWSWLAKNLLAGMSREGLPLSEAISADRGQAAWILLIYDSDQCLGHDEGTVVKADIGHFTLLIKLLLLKPIDVPL